MLVERRFAHRLTMRIPPPTRAHRPMIQRFDAGKRMSEATVHGGIVYLAGQVPEDTSADAEGQTREVLAAIDALLAQAGSDKRRILRAQIYLADIADFDAMNRAGMRGCTG